MRTVAHVTIAPLHANDPDAGLRRSWHPVALADEITAVPAQVWLLGRPWALWRDAGGVRAFADRCPHRLAPITAGTLCADGTIQCGYHGWRFDGAGQCTLIPALGPDAVIPPRARLLAAGAVAELAGVVWLAPEPPLTSLPAVEMPAGGHLGVLEPTRANVDPGEMIDNFLDVAHFPFVHAETFGVEGSDVADEYVVERTDFGFAAVTEHDFANHEDPGVASGERPLRQRRRLTYTYTPPYTATLRIDYVDAVGSNLIVFAVQPEHATASRVYTVLLRNDVAADAMDHAMAFEQRVLAEDLVIQRGLRTALPLDLTVEVHTRADRLTIELRRCLANFLVTASTAPSATVTPSVPVSVAGGVPSSASVAE